MNYLEKIWESVRWTAIALMVIAMVSLLFVGFINLVSGIKDDQKLEDLQRDAMAFDVIDDVRIHRLDDNERGRTCYVAIRDRYDTSPSIDCVPQAPLTSP